MKKVALLIVVVLSVTLLLVACTPSYSWKDVENDVERLKEAGFEIYIENTKDETEYHTESLNRILERAGKDSTVELVNICNLNIDNYTIISFEEFRTEKQAQQVCDYYHETSTAHKLVRFGKILISTNSDKAIELLGYDFK